MKFRTHPLVAFAIMALPLSAPAIDLLTDNFDAPDNDDFDASEQTGRKGGVLADEVQLRSSMVQHSISGNQMRFDGGGRVRFHDIANGFAQWHDFAAGANGSSVLDQRGLRIQFDWLPVNNTDDNWVSWDMGIDGQAVAEPGTRVNHAGTDFGILFRHNGGTQYFDNGAATTGASFEASAGLRHVVLDYSFESFADGENVSISAFVDGRRVLNNKVVQWSGNAGTLFMEIGSNVAGTLLDNVAISTAGLSWGTDREAFFGSATPGALVANLSATQGGTATAAAFTLVAGSGDADNAKFRITDNRLETGNFDFTTAADGTQFSLRVRATGVPSGEIFDQVLIFTGFVDSDNDLIADAFEKVNNGNLTDLDGKAAGPGPGAGSGDFDGDGLTDLQEYLISRSTYPAIDARKADTDGDGLNDNLEITPVAPRVATNPTIADSDGDGLSDNAETNTGTFVDANNTGSNPTLFDTDDDQYPDGYEAANGGQPADSALVPTAVPAGFALVEITDDASSGISEENTYTHKVSGGSAATVNNVVFDVLDVATTPANFEWDGRAGNKAVVVNNNGQWVPASGNVSGDLLGLLGSFTYSPQGPAPGSSQSFTLSGLEAGMSYELRLYIRKWDNGTVRPAALKFTNGTDVSNMYLLEDRPEIVMGKGTSDSAYYLSYRYVAQGDTLVLETTVPAVSTGNGSFHLYGLTNHEAGPPPNMEILSTVRAANGASVAITFTSRPGRVYTVEYTTDLTAWNELADSVPSGGAQTVYTDTVAANLQRAFYRVRDVTPVPVQR